VSDHSNEPVSAASPAVERQLIEILYSQLYVAVPSEETDLISTGTLDSLKFVELLLQIEERFGIKLSLETLQLDQLRSVRQIAAFVLEESSAGMRRPSSQS